MTRRRRPTDEASWLLIILAIALAMMLNGAIERLIFGYEPFMIAAPTTK